MCIRDRDYRYFPDPDLVPVIISKEWLQKVKSREPEFRDEKMARYIEEFELPEYDADIITQYKPLADLFEETVALGNKPKEVSNWIMGETMRPVSYTHLYFKSIVPYILKERNLCSLKI